MEEEFLRLWNTSLQGKIKDDNSCFIDDEGLRNYSTTYKILHGNLQQIFSSDSESDIDDDDDEHKKKRKKSENSQNVKQKQINSKNSMQTYQGFYKLKKKAGRNYVPCFAEEGKIKYPKSSSLNAEEQSIYLQLMMKYSKKHSPFVSKNEQKELQQYARLCDKVVAEHFQFINFVKQRCASTQDRYLLIKSDVKKYIEEVWQHRLSRVSRYPPCYEPLRMLPLVYCDQKRPIIMTLEKSLLEMGSTSVAYMPHFKNCVLILTDYSKMVVRNPPDCKLPESVSKDVIYKVQVSEDRNAENLAISNDADVVMSSSSLKCIADNHAPSFEKNWDIPIIVKEYKQDNGISKKVVYLDKALPPRSLSIMEKNMWFHKVGVKTLICRTPNSNGLRIHGSETKCANFKRPTVTKNTNNVKNKDDVKDGQNPNISDSDSWATTSDIEIDHSVAKIKNESGNNVDTSVLENNCNSKRKREDDYDDDDYYSDVTTDTESKLVIDCSDSEASVKKNNKVQNMSSSKKSSRNKNDVSPPDQNVEDTPRMTRSKARLIERMSSINKTLGHKAIQFVKSEERETVPYSNFNKDNIENNLENPLKNLKLTNVNDSGKNTKSSSIVDKPSVDIVEPKSDCKTDLDFKTQIKCEEDTSAQKSYSQNLSDMREYIKDVDFIPPAPGYNVSYRMWKLKKGESQKEDLKDSFLKGENSTNREIKVLIRNKIDGHQVRFGQKQTMCVVPKLEYQTEFGAECLTPSEITRQWISLFVRPGSHLCRVRVKAATSEVMMIEHRSLQEVAQECIQLTGRPNSSVFGTLYSILLGLIDLKPGHYLLSHSPKLGAFVNLRQSVGNGRINLHDLYNVDPETDALTEGSVWIPIDNNIITPFHSFFNRIPGTFPPKLHTKGKSNSKTTNQKKKKKKKKNKNVEKPNKPT